MIERTYENMGQRIIDLARIATAMHLERVMDCGAAEMDDFATGGAESRGFGGAESEGEIPTPDRRPAGSARLLWNMK